MHMLINRIKRQLGYYPGSSPIPPKPQHEPIPFSELRKRITEQVQSALRHRGFEYPLRKSDAWIRRRTPYIYDLAGIGIVKREPSIGLIQTKAIASLHMPVVEKIYHKVAEIPYQIQSETAGKMLHLVYKKEKLPTAWYLWTTAYSEKTIQMIVDQITNYGLPLLEQVTDYESLLVNPFLSDVRPARKAILLALVGRIKEAQNCLNLAIVEDKNIQANYKGFSPLEVFPEWKAHIRLLEVLRTDQFSAFFAEEQKAAEFTS